MPDKYGDRTKDEQDAYDDGWQDASDDRHLYKKHYDEGFADGEQPAGGIVSLLDLLGVSKVDAELALQHADPNKLLDLIKASVVWDLIKDLT